MHFIYYYNACIVYGIRVLYVIEITNESRTFNIIFKKYREKIKTLILCTPCREDGIGRWISQYRPLRGRKFENRLLTEGSK